MTGKQPASVLFSGGFMSIKKQFNQLAYAAGGAFKTRDDRMNIADRLARLLKDLNVQIKHIDHLKSRHIESYIQQRINTGISKRTIQNEMSAIRAILRQADRDKLADSDRLNNKALGIDNASRNGTHRAMPNEKYEDVFNKLGNIDKGVQACAGLERYLGLRGEEAVQSNKSLEMWQKQLEHGDSIRLIYGSKGGRARDIRPADIDKAREAISRALSLAKLQNGKLIDKPDLKSAQRRHNYCMKVAGAVGEFSAHSLRYAFACDAIERYENQGFSHKDALAQTSMDLGHGDGRGRYIEQVYSRR
jgi:integrase